jgi:hypothetical protein
MKHPHRIVSPGVEGAVRGIRKMKLGQRFARLQSERLTGCKNMRHKKVAEAFSNKRFCKRMGF